MKLPRLFREIAVLCAPCSLAVAALNQPVFESLEVRRAYAAAGDLSDIYNLGVAYAEGKEVAKDPAVAFVHFRTAAEGGLPSAQYNLAVCYLNGDGVAKDDAAAVRWLYAAAAQGVYPAQVLLVECYGQGRGVPKDPARALSWDFIARRTLQLQEQQTVAPPPHPPKVRADGAVEESWAGGTRWLRPDGARERPDPEGGTRIEYPDGRVEWVHVDGHREITYRFGRKQTIFPDGKRITADPDGSVETVMPDGARTWEGNGTTTGGRAVKIRESYDPAGKLLVKRILEADRTIEQFADGRTGIESLVEMEDGSTGTLIQSYTADGQVASRELVRADGRKRSGAEEWTIVRWIETERGTRARVREKYGLGGSVLSQEILGNALTSGGRSAVAGNKGLPEVRPVLVPVQSNPRSAPMTLVPQAVPTPPPEVVRFIPARPLGPTEWVMKPKKDLAPELEKLTNAEAQTHNFAGATEQDYERAKTAAEHFLISLQSPPQKPGYDNWMTLQRNATNSPPPQPRLAPIQDDLSAKYPFGLNGREAITVCTWKHAESDHFVVHYVDQAAAYGVLRFIECAHFVAIRALGVEESGPRKKAHVFVFPKAEWALWQTKHQLPGQVAGYAYKDELLLGAGEEKDEYVKTVCHEATHVIVSQYYTGRKWPLWLNEGFAEYIAAKAVAFKRSHRIEKYLRKSEGSAELASLFNCVDCGVSTKFYSVSERAVRTLFERLPPTGFPRFANLVAAGNPTEEALKATYGPSVNFAALMSAVEK